MDKYWARLGQTKTKLSHKWDSGQKEDRKRTGNGQKLDKKWTKDRNWTKCGILTSSTSTITLNDISAKLAEE